jgi:hypothetical protein
MYSTCTIIIHNNAILFESKGTHFFNGKLCLASTSSYVYMLSNDIWYDYISTCFRIEILIEWTYPVYPDSILNVLARLVEIPLGIFPLCSIGISFIIQDGNVSEIQESYTSVCEERAIVIVWLCGASVLIPGSQFEWMISHLFIWLAIGIIVHVDVEVRYTYTYWFKLLYWFG